MGKINRLDEHLSNMIAAGEVVERPMGIVKELVENCIDAHASNIEIQISQGGIDTITIIDDGEGMDAHDSTLAFERHATSKLKEVNDLWNIHTMGFRGEALPSIASVSHVLLRTNNGTDSTEVEIKYGVMEHAKPCGTPKGTMIEIKNLFQKTPARFKHLKSPQYEFSLISDVVQKFALSHPEIGFCLSHDGRTVFKTKGTGNLLEVLMQIYGRDTAKTAITIDGNDQDYAIKGYAMQPNFNRATKYYMLMYINGRMIRNYHLQKAILDAYSNYIPKDRYPIVVIDMIMDAQLVDVNVHPSKWEIRLSKEKQLEKLLYETLTKSLREQMEVPAVTTNTKPEKNKVEAQTLDFTYLRDEKITKLHQEVNDSFKKPDELPPLDMKELANDLQDPMKKAAVKELTQVSYSQPLQHDPLNTVVEDSALSYTITSDTIKLNQYKQDKSLSNTAFEAKSNKEELVYSTKKPVSIVDENKEVIPRSSEVFTPLNPSLPQLRVIGQFHNSYIIAEGEKGLYIIDQHAAQERYHYECIRSSILSGITDSQQLLIPITIESTLSAASQIDNVNTLLAQIGLHLEVFGESTLVCRELPIWMKHIEEKAFIQDMIDIWEKEKEISIDKLRKHAIATMACHSSIRFHRTLSMDEMKQVIADLAKCEQPFHCPHGRPTLICLEEKELIKDFERG